MIMRLMYNIMDRVQSQEQIHRVSTVPTRLLLSRVSWPVKAEQNSSKHNIAVLFSLRKKTYSLR